METDTPITDEMLVALTDGELDAGTAAWVRAHLAHDPDMASRFAGLAEVRALLSTAPAKGAMPAPDRLKALILGADETARPDAAHRAFGIIDGGRAGSGPRPTPSRPWSARRAMLPLAASISLLVGGGLGWVLGTRSYTGPGLDIELPPRAIRAVTAALDTLPSGGITTFSGSSGAVRGTVAMVASYKVEGGLCRTFDVTVESTRQARETRVSCRRDGTWHTELALIRPSGGNGFATASGGDELVDQYLVQAGGGQALSPDQEREALRR